MRHDNHYVDQLARPGGDPIGRMIPIEEIEANPDQPRQEIGDLSELIASVREKGILEPLIVRPRGGRFQIIAGERRYRAALEVGLDELPCVIRETSDAETMELALIENLQRKDLTPFEEADGLKALAEVYGYTHQAMAEKLGKRRSSVTEIFSLTAMPDEVRQLCRLADIDSKSLLLQIVRQGDAEQMIAFVQKLTEQGTPTRQEAREIAKKGRAKSAKAGRGRPRNYVFKYQPREKSFRLALEFRKSDVPREEIVRALQSIIDELSRERD